MKNSILLVAFIMFSLVSQAGEDFRDRMGPGVYLSNTAVDSSLNENQAVYNFHFYLFRDTTQRYKVKYSIDGKNGSDVVDSKGNLTIETTPGKHIFRFFYNKSYHEVFTDSLMIKPQHVSNYNVVMEKVYIRPNNEYVVFKPVIYLYPKVETEVKVKVDVKGTNPFFYPEYNNGWTCTAQPDGKLKVGEESLNYLFWEADEANHLTHNSLQEGFYVAGKDAKTFLEEKLNEAGFTSKEKADFITFWGPKLQANDHNFVRFEFNEVCDKFADLKIKPRPDHIYRIYILMAPLTEATSPKEQKIEKVNRDGFTVIEWGGQASEIITPNPFNI